MDELDTHLKTGWATFWRAAKCIRDRDADDVQIELFDLAESYAELSAAHVLRDFANSISNGDAAHSDFVSAVSRSYLARVLRDLESRTKFADLDE